MKVSLEKVPVVHVVAFGDAVHVYPAGRRDCAEVLYMVGVAATGDGALISVSAERWAERRPLLPAGTRVVTHN